MRSGISPVDCAVYLGDLLVAFIEVDGEHHYTVANTLRRQDLLKEHLYAYACPGVIWMRVKNASIEDDGPEKVALAFATAIHNRVSKHRIVSNLSLIA